MSGKRLTARFYMNRLPKTQKLLRAPKMKSPKKVWEKEFEDEIKLFCAMDGIELTKRSITKVFEKYLGKLKIVEGSNKIKVKIKCKNGCIQIERIGQ